MSAPSKRPPGSQLVHDLAGSLATISLHLQMLAAEPLPDNTAVHIRESLRAVQLSRRQLADISQLLASAGSSDHRGRSSS